MEIAPAKLTVETAEKSPLTVLEGTTMQETLSGISYKVTDSAGKDVTKTMQENHIWGTGFDDSNVSQIYEPLFTLQEQYFRVSSGGCLTAIKQGGSLNLQLTDKNVEKLSGNVICCEV